MPQERLERGNRSGSGMIADILAMTERLKRQGWTPRSAAEAAEYATRVRYGGRGESPLVTWANANGPEVRVPDVEQRTNYTCGPAALQAGLLALGVSVPEDALAAQAGTTAAGGTSAAGLVEAAEHHGVAAQVRDGMSVDDIADCIDEGCIVLACLQARDREDGDYSHWVVPMAVKVEPGGVVVECMDPGLDGLHSILPLDEWEDRWTCLDESETIHGLAVILRGGDAPSRVALDQARMVMK